MLDNRYHLYILQNLIPDCTILKNIKGICLCFPMILFFTNMFCFKWNFVSNAKDESIHAETKKCTTTVGNYC